MDVERGVVLVLLVEDEDVRDPSSSGAGDTRWQPGSAFMTAATCSLRSAASASPLPFAARIFATTVSTSAIGLSRT